MNFFRYKNSASRFAIIVLISFAVSSVVCADQFLPPNNKILFMIGQDRDTIDQYVANVGNVPAGVMLYTSIQELDGIVAASDRGAGVQDGDYLLKKYPESVLQIGLYMVYALDGILEGSYDDKIKKLGAWLIKADRPIYLRIGYEFDLPDNYYDPQKYVKAFQYIVDKFREMNVNNVAYVWHSYGYLRPGSPIMDWYPGDDYVDWIAVSFFDPYNPGNLRTIANIAKVHDKPFMIAEATPHGLSTSEGEKVWRVWFKRYFEFIDQNNVKAACYINSNWEDQPMWKNKGWGDARIQNNHFIEEEWLKHMQSDKSINPSLKLFMTLENGDNR